MWTTSELPNYVAHSEMVKVQYCGKEIKSVLNCSNNKCGKEYLYDTHKNDSEGQMT
jgi:hypothetical protein